MKHFRLFLFPLAVLALWSVSAAPSHAGWGDALKQKASKVLKTEPSKTASTEESGAVKSRMSPEVTAERLTRFQHGMEVEVAEREKGKKLLASLPTREQREKCSQQAAMSAEVQKLVMDYAQATSNSKPEDVQKHTARMSQQMDSIVTAKCGPDPGKYNANQMVRDAVAKGSDTAALDDAANGSGSSSGDDWTYHVWKEWVLEFCNYIEKLQKDPDAKTKLAKIKDEGLRIPGSGTGVYYVYTATEANLLLERCPSLKPLIEATW